MAQLGAFPTRTAAVTDQIRQDIVSGRLAPGTVIRDNEMAERYGVSSSPIREALAQMQAEHLVEILPNKTKFISRIDRRSVQDFLEVHHILAEAVFARGASRLSDEQIATMRKAFERIESSARATDAEAFVNAARDMLDPIYRASGNAQLRRHVILHATWLLRIMNLLDASYFADAVKGYGQLLDYLEARDHEGACLMHQLLRRRFEKAVLELDLPEE